jgi:hypothetical protein
MVALMLYQATKNKRLAIPLFCGGCFLVLLFGASFFIKV